MTCSWNLADLAGHVYCADTLDEALKKRPDLKPHESVVTRSGVWMGQHWLRLHQPKQDDGSVLERAAAIKTVHASLQSLTDQQHTLRIDLEKLEAQLLELQGKRESVQQEFQSLNELRIQKEGAVAQVQANVERQSVQRQRLEEELSSLQSRLHQSEKEKLDKQAALESSSDALQQDKIERDRLSARRDQLRGQLETLRDQLRQHQQALQDVSIRLETARVKKRGLESSIERMRQQLHERTAHQEQLGLMLEQSDTPISELESQLQEALKKRIESDTQLKECRTRKEEIEQKMRDLDRQRIEKEHALQSLQSLMADTRVALKEFETRRETHLERIAEIGFEIETICEKAAQLPDTLEEMSQNLERLQGRIQRMEPVNLAAVEEYKQENERKTYLESQLSDLREALDTLENAMHKIDQETRSRFKETFERANASLQRFYPQLMGGGKAQMQLTEQDLLNTGVTVLAQPPGKRNTSIHLLSGGEKALTAIALVFSLFELNPAPFCVLDEVDAPLDDYNVGRYAEMIRQMSDKVQFIFITHNKITMDVANQLIGVTMHEAGVSRPVDVDIDRAIELAAA
ncbi:MAG: hypothetical protein D6698_00850 [Gammaproteobacteria bacterium]|nr:MAG: hypothetical protein D6698_00850 [Gammaproteobacteria bacterium]